MPDRPHLLVQGVVLLLAAACSGSNTPVCTPSVSLELATSDGWRIMSAAEDPFSDRLTDVNCVVQSITVEGPALEIGTDECNYVTLVQPTTEPMTDCDVFQATVLHSPLIADEPATAHVALRLGDTTVLDEMIPIPSDAQIFEVKHPMGRDVPAGTPLYLHVHNHGSNAWFITDVRRAP